MLTSLIETFVFQPTRALEWTPADARLAYEDVFLTSGGGPRIHAWWVPAGGRAPVLLFCHGNAGNIGDRVHNVKLLHDAGIAVLIFDYRGYGRSEGKATEQGCYQDSRAAWDWLTKERAIDPRQVSVFGRSLGGAVAIELATRVAPRALVVESTFTSIADMAPVAMPIIPKGLLPRMFDSRSRTGDVHCPVLVIHGTRDELVPFRMGQALFEAFQAPKQFLALEGAGHNDTVDVGGAPYIDRIRGFLGST